MNENVIVTEADFNNPDHGKDIIVLLSAYAKDIMGGGSDLTEYVKENLITQLQKRQGALVLLTYHHRNAIGLTIAFEGFSTFYAKPLINIHDFVVLEKYRGRGIAKLMLEKIEQIALNRDCCKLTLEVLEGNVRAQKVYHAFGFASYVLDKKMGKALFLDKKIVKI